MDPLLPPATSTIIRPSSARLRPSSASSARSSGSNRPRSRVSESRRYFFDGEGAAGQGPAAERGGGGGTERFYEVKLVDGDSSDVADTHFKYSYGEFLAPMPEPSRRAEDGLRSGDSSVDLADLECFLRDAKPRTWRDALPMFVLARNVLSSRFSGTLQLAHKELEEARAQNAELRAALEEAQEENKQAQVKYDTLEGSTAKSYERLMQGFNQTQQNTVRKQEFMRRQVASLEASLAAEKEKNAAAEAKHKEHERKIEWRDSECARLENEVKALTEAHRIAEEGLRAVAKEEGEELERARALEQSLAVELQAAHLREGHVYDAAALSVQLEAQIEAADQDAIRAIVATLSHTDKFALSEVMLKSFDGSELHQTLIQVFSQFDERTLDGHDQFDARTLDVRELPHLMQLDKEQQQALAQALLASASKA